MGDDNTLLRLEGRPSRALVGSTIGFFTGFTMISVFSPFSKLFADFMNLTPTMIGLLVSIPTLSSAILRIPFSAMTDTTGGRKPFLILLILSMAGLLGLSMVLSIVYPQGLTKETYPILLFLGALCGCGGATFSVGISQISYWFPQRKQGSVLGVYAGLGNMSPGFASILFPLTPNFVRDGAVYVPDPSSPPPLVPLRVLSIYTDDHSPACFTVDYETVDVVQAKLLGNLPLFTPPFSVR